MSTLERAGSRVLCTSSLPLETQVRESSKRDYSLRILNRISAARSFNSRDWRLLCVSMVKLCIVADISHCSFRASIDIQRTVIVNYRCLIMIFAGDSYFCNDVSKANAFRVVHRILICLFEYIILFIGEREREVMYESDRVIWIMKTMIHRFFVTNARVSCKICAFGMYHAWILNFIYIFLNGLLHFDQPFNLTPAIPREIADVTVELIGSFTNRRRYGTVDSQSSGDATHRIFANIRSKYNLD